MDHTAEALFAGAWTRGLTDPLGWGVLADYFEGEGAGLEMAAYSATACRVIAAFRPADVRWDRRSTTGVAVRDTGVDLCVLKLAALLVQDMARVRTSVDMWAAQDPWRQNATRSLLMMPRRDLGPGHGVTGTDAQVAAEYLDSNDADHVRHALTAGAFVYRLHAGAAGDTIFGAMDEYEAAAGAAILQVRDLYRRGRWATSPTASDHPTDSWVEGPDGRRRLVRRPPPVR